jgi:hypothetical protein
MRVSLLVALSIYNAVASAMDIPDWTPAKVIDSSQAVIVATRNKPSHLRAFANGMLMDLKVLRNLGGELRRDTVFRFFQPSGDIHSGENVTDEEFVLFLKRITSDQILQIEGALTSREEIWTFAEARQQWMAYYPLKGFKGAEPRSLLRHRLEAENIRGSPHQMVEFFQRLVRLRGDPQARDANAKKLNKFELDVLTTGR